MSCQSFLDETNHLDLFHSGFRPHYGTETPLVTLKVDLNWEMDKGNATLLILLDLSVTFDTINHGFLMDCLSVLQAGFRK